MARLEDMATIDAALAGVQEPAEQPEDADSGPAPQVAPGVETPVESPDKPKMTADEKRAFDATRQAAIDRQKMLDDAMQAQQKERDAFKTSGQKTAAALRRVVKGTGVRLASLPTPGSIVLPLVVLLAFFFLLLPVNGHTRFMWLWLVVTGNADIGQGSGASDTKGSGTAGPASPPDTIGSGDTGTGTTAPPVTPPGGGTIAPQPPPISPVLPLFSFTGVEDLS